MYQEPKNDRKVWMPVNPLFSNLSQGNKRASQIFGNKFNIKKSE